MPDPRARETLRFGEFQLNPAAYELLWKGRTVRLERLPMDLLMMLVERRGDVVTRAEIVDRLWGKDVFVDVETGVHTAIRKIRQALRDSAETPAFIETVPGRGYRFVAPVEILTDGGAGAAISAPVGSDEPAAIATTRVGPPPSARLRRAAVLAGALVLAVSAAFAAWRWASALKPCSRVARAVLPFENLGGDPERGYLADGLTEEMIASVGSRTCRGDRPAVDDGLQRQRHEVARGDRPRGRGGLSPRELTSRGGRAVSNHDEADSGFRSGPGVV